MYYKHVSVALTFLLTLNDINKPIHGFFYTECSQEVAAILDCFLPPITKKKYIKMDCRDKIQLKK